MFVAVFVLTGAFIWKGHMLPNDQQIAIVIGILMLFVFAMARNTYGRQP